MTWVKLDDGFFLHPKAIAAGRDGRDVWLAALCYANQQLTDGIIPAHALPIIGTLAGVVDYDAAAARLVDVNLWINHVDGWEIHGYLDRQLSKEQREAWLAKDREKKRKQREAAKGTQTSPVVPEGILADSRKSPAEILSIDSIPFEQNSSSSRSPKNQTPHTTHTTDDDDDIKATINAIADTRTRRYNPSNPNAYKASLKRDPELHQRATELTSQHPNLTPAERAELDQPPPTTTPQCTHCQATTHTTDHCPIKE